MSPWLGVKSYISIEKKSSQTADGAVSLIKPGYFQIYPYSNFQLHCPSVIVHCITDAVKHMTVRCRYPLLAVCLDNFLVIGEMEATHCEDYEFLCSLLL